MGDESICAQLKKEWENTPLGKDYRGIKERKDDADAIDEVKLLVYNDLYSFFSRYYDEGDFAPRFRYSIKGHKYAIPYNGEEVKLYWANSDQYYIKTGVLFRDYAFFSDGSKTYKIILRTVAAKEELSSNKATKARLFVLDGSNPLEWADEKTLIIRLQYRELTAAEVKKYEAGGGSNTAKQEKINQNMMDAVLEGLDSPHLKGALSKFYKNDKPLLIYQLSRFTAKNSRDFFIHKNLKKFLSEQLDYFIKSEVISLETLERERSLDRHITRARVVREIGEKIIDFLAQIEDFQKKLWEKKKFVLKTHYVITTDRIPEEFHQKILKNKAQLEEWEALGFGAAPPKEALKEKKLPVDTKHFSHDFKEKLLEKLTETADLDELLDGLMIKSENWQGLNLLLNKYRDQVNCVYIDPPYNTGNDEFQYKDSYQHSSWLTMNHNRLDLLFRLMNEVCGVFINIDDGEAHYLKILCDAIFGRDNFVRNIVWQKRTSPDMRAALGDGHDHIMVYAKCLSAFANFAKKIPKTHEQKAAFKNPDNDPRGPWVSSDFTAQGYRPNQMYEIATPGGAQYFPPEGRCWKNVESVFLQIEKEGRMWFGADRKGVPRRKTYLSESEENAVWSWWSNKEVGHNQEAKKESIAFFGVAGAFMTPKPERLLRRIVHISSNFQSIILDFFPGSGTTAHAVMNLNNEDGGKPKFILIEMANYFDTVMVPRIKKVAYSFNWKDGKPKDSGGNGVFFKYQVLEQYEDTLDNLELKENEDALSLFGNDYLLKYFLDFESRDEAALVNFEEFKKPFSYRLKVNFEEVGEPEEVLVDLPETFHYLLGLKVKKIKVRWDGSRKYLFTLGEKGNRDVAVVWREYDDQWTTGDFEKDKAFIIQEMEGWAHSVVYVNGQSALTPKMGSHTVEVRAIEPEFRKRMVSP